MKEPRWLTRQIVEAVLDVQLEGNGGLPGLRDGGALESAIGRPMHRWPYAEAKALFDCAASYGFGLAKNHALNDATKRTAFVVMAVFRLLNGQELDAGEEEAIEVMVSVADGSLSETQLATWLTEHCTTPKRKGEK